MMPVVAIVQARMGSTRLPGKVLTRLGGMPSIEHTLRRTMLAVLNTILAVPATPENGRLLTLKGPWTRYAGHESDVLLRYAHCMQWFSAQPHIVVRVTGDCPFVDPDQIDLVVQAVRNGADYASNVYCTKQWIDTRISQWPVGLDVEAFTSDLLFETNQRCHEPEAREHVTWGMRRIAKHPIFVAIPTPGKRFLGRLRWVLDTAEDRDHLRWLAARVPCPLLHPTTEELLEAESLASRVE